MSKAILAQQRPKMTAEEAQSFKSYSVGNAVLVKTALKCGCEPYADVFTYRRWQAQGLQVRRGERAIKLPVITERETEEDDGTTKTRRVFHTSAVFCRHQVDGANGNGRGERLPPTAIETPARESPRNESKPKRNGHKPDYAPIHVNDSTFPNRRAWPKNAKGGLKISPYTITRKRHEGVRCYGGHRGNKCIPFDFAKCPSIPQATWRAWTSQDQNANDRFARDVEGKAA